MPGQTHTHLPRNSFLKRDLAARVSGQMRPSRIRTHTTSLYTLVTLKRVNVGACIECLGLDVIKG